MGDIYKSILPFVALQLLGLAAAVAFPQVVTWLPATLLWK
jgi:TRAP-type mannitol/chloroaromatic compound transport system permease large subunit